MANSSLLQLLVVLFLFCTTGIYCQDSCQVNGDLKLINGLNSLEGRVNICVDNTWTLVRINPPWGNNEVDVVCRQIGRQLGVDIYRGFNYRNYFIGSNNVSPWKVTASCTGNELNLLNCHHMKNQYSNTEALGVVCIRAESESSLLTACAMEETVPEFTCPLQICGLVQNDTFRSDMVCNGRDDCGDCSDECHCSNDYGNNTCRSASANTTTCSCDDKGSWYNRELQCSNGFCVAQNSMCDGVDNCGDCSDECQCSYSIDQSYQCLDANPSAVCNCGDDQFLCNDGPCIESNMFCDGRRDCRDESDETNQECLDRKAESLLKIKRNAVRRREEVAGGILGAILLVVIIWLVILGVCCIVPFCPLRKTYSLKTVSRVEANANRTGVSDEGRRDGELETSTAPLTTNSI